MILRSHEQSGCEDAGAQASESVYGTVARYHQYREIAFVDKRPLSRRI